MQARIIDCFTQPMIPVLNEIGPHESLIARASAVCLQGVRLGDLASVLGHFEAASLAHVALFVHLDLLKGIAADEAGLAYLAAHHRRIAGVITTRHSLILHARKLGFWAVLRLFFQDSLGAQRGIHNAERSRPDAVEILSAVSAVEMAEELNRLAIPRIGTGLVRSRQTAQRVIASGCQAVSASSPRLWQMNKALALPQP